MIKHRRFYGPVLALAAAAGMLVSCASQARPAQWSKAALYGMVYNGDGLPERNVRVSLNGETAALSDSNGRFVVPDLARGEHELRLEKAGLETSIRQIDFQERGDILYVRLFSARQLLEAALAAWREGDRTAALDRAERAVALAPERKDARYLLLLILARRQPADSDSPADTQRHLGFLRSAGYDPFALALLENMRANLLEDASGSAQ